MINKITSPVIVAAYLRYSSDNQSENSFDYQIKNIRKFCEKNGFILPDEYIYKDAAKTGTNENRPGFKKLKSDAANNPEWCKIIFNKLSREARNVRNALNSEAYFEQCGIETLSATEEYLNGPKNYTIRIKQHADNEEYSRQLSENTMDGMRSKAENGVFLGGIPPLGYDIKEQAYVINEQEAEIVKDIFAMYLRGISYSKMAELLNKRGYRTKTGSMFRKTSFNSILTQEKYTGTYTWNMVVEKHTNGHKLKPLDEQIHIENALPPIIDKDTFEKAQTKMRHRAGKKPSYYYMLDNKIYCSCCNSPMIGRTRQDRNRQIYRVYVCSRHEKDPNSCSNAAIRADTLETYVAQSMVLYSFHGVDIKELSAHLQTGRSITELEAKKRKLETARKNAMLLFERCPSSTVEERYVSLTEEIVELDEKIVRLKTQSISLDNNSKKRIMTKMYRYLKESPDHEALDYIDNTLSGVYVGRDSVSVHIQNA